MLVIVNTSSKLDIVITDFNEAMNSVHTNFLSGLHYSTA